MRSFLSEFGFDAVMGSVRGHKDAYITDDERLWSKTVLPGSQEMLDRFFEQVSCDDFAEVLSLLNQTTVIGLPKSDDPSAQLANFPTALRLIQALARYLVPAMEVDTALHIMVHYTMGEIEQEQREGIKTQVREQLVTTGIRDILTECLDQDLTPYICQTYLYDDDALGLALGAVLAKLILDKQYDLFNRLHVKRENPLQESELASAFSTFWTWRQNSKDDDELLLKKAINLHPDEATVLAELNAKAPYHP